MLVVVINGPSFQEAKNQITKALEFADVVELRLDLFTDFDIAALDKLRQTLTIPVIFTLKKSSQGGFYTESEESRLALLKRIASLHPEYLDVESDTPSYFIENIRSLYPTIKILLSYHDFDATPQDFNKIYKEMKTKGASLYKIAVMAHDSVDALRLICFRNSIQDPHLIVISMGVYGQISRILSPIIRNPMTYASLEEAIAPGQLSAKMLVERYHHKILSPTSSIYALIGDPIEQSISDRTHNHLITSIALDAVYVKIRVIPSKLASLLHFIKQLPFKGISVTMPLKEVILTYLDEIDLEAKKIGAVNTLCISDGKIKGFNTDGVGAINALESSLSVKNKRIGIIGAGGAAKAIAYEAYKRGAFITVINRNVEKANTLAKSFNGKAFGLDQMRKYTEEGYDILINTTPVPMPLSKEDILGCALIMDIKTIPKETLFLKYALEKNCLITYGYQMFVEQAIGQWVFWINPSLSIDEWRKHLQAKTLEIV